MRSDELEGRGNESMATLTGKVALITGGARGIGFGCSQVLAAAGAAVAIIDVDNAAASAAVREIVQTGATAEAFIADVSQSAAVEQVVATVIERFGQIDILINNAGTHDGKSLEQATEADWDRILTTNLKSVYLMTRATLPYLKQTQGTIIQMSSMVGLVGQANAAAYAASKGGIIALTKNLALDLAGYGIRVNCICPGWVDTPLVHDWFALQTDEKAARAHVAAIHPLGRIAAPAEIGAAALFLASAQSSFVTGVILPVEGGVTLGY